MPPVYLLNPPPNPFWDFVAGLEDHPFFVQQRRPVPPTPPEQPPRPNQEADTTTAAPESSKTDKGKQPEVTVTEDPPVVDPSTVRPDGPRNFPFRGRGRFVNSFEQDNANTNTNNDKEDCEDSRKHGPRGCHGRRGRHGPPPPPGGFGAHPFMFGPPWLRQHHHVPGEFPEGDGPARHGPPHRGGPFWRGGPGHHGRGGPHRGPHHRHGHHGRGSPSPPPPNNGGFDLATFLNNLGERIGIDLGGAVEGLGLEVDRFKAGRTGTDVDFEPRTDIFDHATAYTIHLSLPGAKKSDVGVDWDGEHSTLRIAGVVHRPGVDEDMMRQLAVDGRKRETGVFEKNIRLGTKKDPASIDIAAISAKMTDGVLVVRVPKLEKHFEKKEVRVDGSPEPEYTERPEDTYMNEKDLLFDAEDDDKDEDMYDSAPEPTSKASAAQGDRTAKDKKSEAEEDQVDRSRSHTVDFESPNDRDQQQQQVEALPPYETQDEKSQAQAHAAAIHEDEMSDWEKAGSDDEGEYVKINVN